MINSKIPIEDKLELVYKFYRAIWDTELVVDDRPEPSTPAQMLKNIETSMFPALKLLELETHWNKARQYFYVAGDNSMLHMDGDPTPEDAQARQQRMLDAQEEENRIMTLLENGDEEDEAEIRAYENKIGMRFARFPKTIEREYVGLFESYENGHIKLQDNPQTFPACGDLFDNFDLKRPITIVTSEIKCKDKTWPETVLEVRQEAAE